MRWVIVALTIVLVAAIWSLRRPTGRFAALSLLNSHFGSRVSQSESDVVLGTTTDNWVTRAYQTEVNCQQPDSKTCAATRVTPLPEIHVRDLTCSRFRELTQGFRRPLVVRGFMADCDAVNKWSLAFFRQSPYGECEMPIIEDASLEKQSDYLKSMKSEMTTQRMRDFVNDIAAGRPAYLNNVSRIFGLRPELLDDMRLQDVERYTGMNIYDSSSITNMFIGGQNTGTSLHCAVTGNFFYNIKGRKRWQLIDPCYTRYLRPSVSRSGLFAVSRFDICAKDAAEADFPAVPRYTVTLEEGDMLFNPPWWWHAITNETPYTIGCANRFSNLAVAMRNNPLYTAILLSHPIINAKDYMLPGKSKQQRNLQFDKSLLRDITGR